MSKIRAFGLLAAIGCLTLAPAASCYGQAGEQINWSSFELQAPSTGHSGMPPVVTAARLQPGGSLVAVVGDDHVVSLYDRDVGRFVHQLTEHHDWVRTARFSPDGSRLATAGNDRRLILWDMAGSIRSTEIARHPAAIVDVAFSPAGDLIATAGFENRVRVYSVNNGRLVHELAAGCQDLRTVAFSPDGDHLATGGRDGIIELFDLASGQRVDSWPVHSRRIRSLLFLDDRQIASCGEDCHVHIVDIDHPAAVRTLPDEGGKLFTICKLPNGLLATGGSDNTITVWNPESLELAGQLRGHAGSITSLDASENILVSASYDTRIRFWTTEKIAQDSGEPLIRR